MSIRSVILAGFAVSFIGSTAHAQTRWDHNGSVMILSADGAKRVFRYETPKPGLPASVTSGTVLFEGRRESNRYIGQVSTFSTRCGARRFSVEGTVGEDQRSVTLHGAKPVLDANCKVRSHQDEVLAFQLIQPEEDGQSGSAIKAPSQAIDTLPTMATPVRGKLRPFRSSHGYGYRYCFSAKQSDSLERIIADCTRNIESFRGRDSSLELLDDDLSSRGEAYMWKGDYNRAIIDLEESVERGSTGWVSETENGTWSRLAAVHLCDLAFMYAETGDFDRALRKFEPAFQIVDRQRVIFRDMLRAEVLRCRAAFYARAGKRDLAFTDYDASIEAAALYTAIGGTDYSDELTRSYSARADAFALYKDVPSAISDWLSALKAVQWDEGTVRGVVELMMRNAAAHLAGAEYELAFKYYDALARTDSSAPKATLKQVEKAYALFGRGVAKLRLGDSPGGLADIKEAESMQPTILEKFAKSYGITIDIAAAIPAVPPAVPTTPPSALVKPTASAAPSVIPPSASDCTQAEAHWKSAENIDTVAVYEDHLARFANCDFATLAKVRIEQLKRR